MARDIICDKLVTEEQAVTERLFKRHRGRTYYFCSRKCLDEFERDPDYYCAQKPGFYSGHDAAQIPAPPPK